MGLTAVQSDGLRAQLMEDRQLRLTEKFAEYGCTTLPDSFWDGERRDWTPTIDMTEGTLTGGAWQEETLLEQLIPRDRGRLKAALRSSYAARCSFVDTGARIGGPMQDLSRTQSPPDQGDRLSFPGLRLLLRGMIEHELRARTTGDGMVPDLVLAVDPPKARAADPAKTWSTPRPGTRVKDSRRRRG
jgi:hypothetical protein